MLGMPAIRVYEVASFYTMFYRQPVGKHVVQICRTTPCWLRGSDAVTKACFDKLGIGIGQTTADEQFTLVEVECLGACVNAPVVQVNDDYFEDLDYDSMCHLIDALKSGKPVAVGSQTGRMCSAPEGGPQTLKGVEVISSDQGTQKSAKSKSKKAANA
jgi:NADH-quinone oxidoreductase subunit E